MEGPILHVTERLSETLFKDLFWHFRLLLSIGQIRTDRKQSGREIGGCDQERSLSQDSTQDARSTTVLYVSHAAHKAIALKDSLNFIDVTCAGWCARSL